MRRTAILVLGSLAAVGVVAALVIDTAIRPSHVDTVLMLRSEILDEVRRVAVRLPEHYDADTGRRYAVLYKLDGDSRLEHYDAAIDALHRAGASPEIIVVAIPNAEGQRNRDLTPSSMSQGDEPGGPRGEGGRLLDFIERELAPHIDARFRTTSQRALAGYSRGGLLVVSSLLTHPSLFQARLAFSPALWREEHRVVRDAERLLAATPALRGLLYMSLGDRENDKMRAAFEDMRHVLGQVAPAGLEWYAEDVAGGNHQTAPVLAIPSALGRLARHLATTGS